MKSILLVCLAVLGVFPVMQSHAQNTPHTPAVGSKERTGILDTIRKPVQDTLKKPVLFKVPVFNVLGDWAFMSGSVVQPDGNPMNYDHTPYAELIKDGTFEDWFCALLRKKNGEWTVIQWQIGATDLAYVGWDELYKAPAALFPK